MALMCVVLDYHALVVHILCLFVVGEALKWCRAQNSYHLWDARCASEDPHLVVVVDRNQSPSPVCEDPAAEAFLTILDPRICLMQHRSHVYPQSGLFPAFLHDFFYQETLPLIEYWEFAQIQRVAQVDRSLVELGRGREYYCEIHEVWGQ